jgi:flagellar motor switch protein FliM
MEKILTQQEIDTMVNRARAGTHATAVAASFSRWDYRQAGRLGRDQMVAISALHDGFARTVTHSIGAYLRTAFQVSMTSAEHLTCAEFLSGIPELTYLVSCKVSPFNASGLIQLDLGITFALIDVLLGGEGASQPPSRDITEIEEQVAETAMRIIFRELQTAWQALAVEFEFEERKQTAEAQQLMALEERMLCLGFEVALKERRGGMTIAIPTVISSALLRKLSVVRPRFYTRPDSPDFPRQWRKALRNCPFRLDLGLPARALSSELADVHPGKVIALSRAANAPATFFAHDQPIYTANVARVGQMRAAQIISAIESPTERKPV